MGSGLDMATIHLSKISGFTPDPGPEPITAQAMQAGGYDSGKLFPAALEAPNVDGKTMRCPSIPCPCALLQQSIAAKAGLLDEQGKLKPITCWHSSTRRSRAFKGQGAMGLEHGDLPCPICRTASGYP